MNRDDVLAFLAAAFGSIAIDSSLRDELVTIISRSGFERNFFNLLLVRLKYLSEHGTAAVLYREGFESLSNKAEGIYSMRLIGTGFNIRILYACLPNGAPALLLGFHERSGKRISSYGPHIPVAKARLKSLLEAYSHDESE